MIPAAAPGDAMHDQLEYLIEHVDPEHICGCGDCARYFKVRLLLLQPFADRQPKVLALARVAARGK